MVSSGDLPHLLRLVDDPSPVVQTEVAIAFSSLGAGLDVALDELPEPPGATERRAIAELIRAYRRGWLQETWPALYGLDDDMERLEQALSLIACFQNGPEADGSASDLLDQLAEDFEHRPGGHDAVDLARFLFVERGLTGTRSDYYKPENSNITHVILHKEGIPITLACIYMLTGDRVGLEIGGCNWPSHFLARTYVNGVLTLVDCFNGGKCTDVDAFLKMQGPSREAARTMLRDEAPPDIILSRVLNNLMRAYRKHGNQEDCDLMGVLRRDLDQHMRARRP